MILKEMINAPIGKREWYVQTWEIKKKYSCELKEAWIKKSEKKSKNNVTMK